MGKNKQHHKMGNAGRKSAMKGGSQNVEPVRKAGSETHVAVISAKLNGSSKDAVRGMGVR